MGVKFYHVITIYIYTIYILYTYTIYIHYIYIYICLSRVLWHAPITQLLWRLNFKVAWVGGKELTRKKQKETYYLHYNNN